MSEEKNQGGYFLLAIQLQALPPGGKLTPEMMEMVCEVCSSSKVSQSRTDLFRLFCNEYSEVKNICDICIRKM